MTIIGLNGCAARLRRPSSTIPPARPSRATGAASAGAGQERGGQQEHRHAGAVRGQALVHDLELHQRADGTATTRSPTQVRVSRASTHRTYPRGRRCHRPRGRAPPPAVEIGPPRIHRANRPARRRRRAARAPSVAGATSTKGDTDEGPHSHPRPAARARRRAVRAERRLQGRHPRVRWVLGGIGWFGFLLTTLALIVLAAIALVRLAAPPQAQRRPRPCARRGRRRSRGAPRFGGDLAERGPRPLGGLVGDRRAPLDPSSRRSRHRRGCRRRPGRACRAPPRTRATAPARSGSPGRPERHRHRAVEEPPGLQAVHLGEVGGVAVDRVEVLAADHPERRLRELARDVRRVVARGEPERLREQPVAREQRGRGAVLRPDLGLPRRSASSSSSGMSSWTSEKLCTSSIAAAAGRIRSGSAPTASPTASAITGRTRLPPIESA